MINFKELYVQSGSLTIFNCFPFMRAMGKPSIEVFGGKLTPMAAFCKKTMCHVYYEKSILDDLAVKAVKKLSTDCNFIYNNFKKSCKNLQALSFEAHQNQLEPRDGFKKIWNEMQEMWKWSIFIDSLDAGTDFKEIQRIARECGLSKEETQVLTTPSELSYLQEFEQLLLQAADNENFEKLLSEFFWINTSYAEFGKFTEKDAKTEIKNRGAGWRETVEGFSNYVHKIEEKQEKILKAKKLSENPLLLFNKLVSWRDERKRFNFTGLHGIGVYARQLMKNVGLPIELYCVVTPEEYFSQKYPSNDELIKRFNVGALAIGLDDYIEIIFGTEAVKIFNKLQTQRLDKPFDLRGQPACLGRVTGKVIVVHGPKEFASFEEGAILVTGMTRPEFVPIMKKSAGIITDEGGVTCHAAIVSRELNKPCIIGTQNASKVLKTGDVVELDAFHGLVKKVD